MSTSHLLVNGIRPTIQAVPGSKWRSELENYLPETFFPMAENSLKVFSPEIVPLLQQENKLAPNTASFKLAEIEFKVKPHNLPGMAKFAQDPDREVRRQA